MSGQVEVLICKECGGRKLPGVFQKDAHKSDCLRGQLEFARYELTYAREFKRLADDRAERAEEDLVAHKSAAEIYEAKMNEALAGERQEVGRLKALVVEHARLAGESSAALMKERDMALALNDVLRLQVKRAYDLSKELMHSLATSPA